MSGRSEFERNKQKPSTSQKKETKASGVNSSYQKTKKSCESLIKGKLFELIIGAILEKSGFSQDLYSDQLTQNRKKLHGGGATYDHDYCGTLTIGIPFLNPIMIVGESKFYEIKISTAREFLGAYTDLSQYSKIDTKAGGNQRYKKLYEPRYNYCPIMFSYKGFNNSAKGLLYTHGINFISYHESQVFKEISEMYKNVISKLNYNNITKSDLSKFFKKTDKIENLKQIGSKSKKKGFDESINAITSYLENIYSSIGVLDNRFTVNILSIRQKKEKNLFHFGKHSSLRYTGKGKFEIRTKQGKTTKAEFCLPEGFLESYYQYIKGKQETGQKKIEEGKMSEQDFIDPVRKFMNSLSIVNNHDGISDILGHKIDDESRQRIIESLENN